MKRIITATLLLAASAAFAQTPPPRPVWTVETLPLPAPLTAETNKQPNSYRSEYGFLKLPPGRVMGSTSAAAVDSKGHVWVAERCGANTCGDSAIDPIMEFDAAGNFIKAFGGGLSVFPHGFYIDAADNVWLTDARAIAGPNGGRGARVMKFSPGGKLLLTLGKPGVQGKGTDVFTEPNAVIVAKNGDIFVADGHEAACRPHRLGFLQAPEAVVQSVDRINRKRGRLLLVERAQADVARALPLEPHMLADDLDDVGGLPDLFELVVGNAHCRTQRLLGRRLP